MSLESDITEHERYIHLYKIILSPTEIYNVLVKHLTHFTGDITESPPWAIRNEALMLAADQVQF